AHAHSALARIAMVDSSPSSPKHYNEAMQEAVIIDCLRTPVGKAPRGALRNTRPDELAATVVRRLLEQYPQVPPAEIEDVILGCAMPEAESGSNMARVVALRAGLPDTVTGITINRFC